MAGFIFKPSTRKGPVFLSPSDAGAPPTITLPDGKVVTAVRADQAGGVFAGHDGYQYVFPREVLGQKGAKLSYGGQTQDLGDTNMSYRGDSLGQLAESTKGAIGSTDLGIYTPGEIGFGSTAADLTGEFPTPTMVNYKGAPGNYKFTDPIKFAEKYSDFNRRQIRENFNVASDIALKEVDTELAGMRSFIPAASALKRSETSLDNVFNQNERNRQVDATLPDARRQLREQGTRAEIYARGEVPDSITDRALELGVRSNAADLASAGGFGANSRLSGKISDLMSAEKRIQLSEYGDRLLGTNVKDSANLLLAPTEYSNAGEQIKVNPSIDAGSRAASTLQDVNNNTLISPTNALSSVNQQNQFNASNKIQLDEFNANTDNTFKQNLFNYKVGLAGQYAGANQTDINTRTALDQQAQARDEASKQAQAKRRSDNWNAGANLLGTVGSLFSSSLSTGGGSNSSSGNGNFTTLQLDNTPDFTSDPGSSTFNQSPPTNFDSSQPFDHTLRDDGSAQPEQYHITDTQRAAARTVNNVASDLGAPKRLAASISPAVAQQVVQASEAPIRMAGISNTPSKLNTFVGNNSKGQPVYADTQLVKSNDVGAGTQFVNTLKGALDPLGVFSKDDSNTLAKVGTVASDAAFIDNLSSMYQNGDKKGFISALGNRLGNSAIKNTNLDSRDKAGLAGVLSAYNLFENWDHMSGAQKSLGIASIGLQGYKYGTGQNLASKEVIPATSSTPGLNVGQALNLFSAGVNVYGLVNNWDQYNTFQKVTLGTGTAAQVAQTAQSLGILGSGATNAVVPNVTAQGLAAAGWTSAPQVGVGAVVAPAGTSVPAGYTAVASEGGKTVAIPAGNEGTFAQGLQTAGGVTSIALGAKTVYDGWQGSGKSGVINGAVGGSMIVAGMSALGSSALAGPYAPLVAAGIVGTAIALDATGGQKGKDQLGRDQTRKTVVKSGIADSDYKVTLADGSKFDIGVDGHGQQFDFRHPDQLVDKGRVGKKANAWDIDYTNDLDYAAGMGGLTLSRLLHGGISKPVDQMGGQLSNAAISSVGHGQDMTPENYEKVAANLRGMYSKAGIKDKGSAYQLANQAFAEKRIDDTQLVAMHQAINMMFDKNGYDTAQKLMAGRNRGIEAATQIPQKDTLNPTATGEAITKLAQGVNTSLTKEQIQARNAAENRQKRLDAEAANRRNRLRQEAASA